MKALVSVIVPVYKVEAYICQCIESIQRQTYTNLEIFLVDDGSPDRCGQICDQYALKDQRIKVIHKENGGLSDARNAALDEMRGDYVVFVDSDDYVSPFYVENLYDAINQAHADMSVSWFKHVYEGDRVEKPEKNSPVIVESLTRQKCYEKLLSQDGVEMSAWGKMYRSSLFEDLRYPKGKLYEDIPVTYRAIAKSRRIAKIKNADYFYLQRTDSIQSMKFNPGKLDCLKHMRELTEFINQEFPDLSDAARCRYFSCVCNILFQIPSGNPMRKKLWSEIVKNRWNVIKNRKARKKAKLAALASFFGYRFMRELYKKTEVALKKSF